MARGSNTSPIPAPSRKGAIDQNSRLRFAPSPTGSLHIGSARVALYNFLLARHFGAKMTLRIEDTDLERSTEENTKEIFNVMRMLGLDWDETPVIQTERADRHKELLDKLIREGKVYRSLATKDTVDAWHKSTGKTAFRGTDEGAGAYRLKLTDGVDVSFDDLVVGPTSFSTDNISDPVIARADGRVLYNFAVAVDDADAEITHVVRGADHISNTPTQILILRALGMPEPTFAHLPLIMGPDGKKLSKRHQAEDGSPLAVTAEQLVKEGYLPEAILSYVSRLGWGTDDDGVLSLAEMIDKFDIKRVNSNPARYDMVKMLDTNGQMMRALSDQAYAEKLSAFMNKPNDERMVKAAGAIKEKASTLVQAAAYLDYLYAEPTMDPKSWKKAMKPESKAVLLAAKDMLESIDWNATTIHDDLMTLTGKFDIGPGKVFQPIRVALTGSTVSAGIGETIALLEREVVLARIDAAIAKLESEAR